MPIRLLLRVDQKCTPRPAKPTQMLRSVLLMLSASEIIRLLLMRSYHWNPPLMYQPPYWTGINFKSQIAVSPVVNIPTMPSFPTVRPLNALTVPTGLPAPPVQKSSGPSVTYVGTLKVSGKPHHFEAFQVKSMPT